MSANDDRSRGPGFSLTLWFLFVLALLVLLPQPSPMKTYRPHGWYHYVTLGLIPIGAWRAARLGGSEISYFVYGILCTLLFSLELAHSLPFWASDADYLNRGAIVLALPMATGFGCRYIASLRWGVDGKRRNRLNFCRCGYNLTGNASGICPECGTPVERA